MGAPFPLLTVQQLRDLPPQTWLVESVIPQDALALLYGASGTYKTFVALDLACSVASGRAWHGRLVKPGRVVYLAGEGVRGIPARVAAWEARHGRIPDHSLLVVPLAANLMDSSERDRLARTLQPVTDLRLIVVDTYARHMTGGDENSSRDAGIVVDALDRIRRAHKATVLVVHHTGKDPARDERGSSGLPAAADTRIKVTADGDSIRLTNPKQKDAEEFRPLLLAVEHELDSLVIVSQTRVGQLTDHEQRILAAVPTLSHDQAHTYRLLAKAAGMSKSSAERATKSLLDSGLLTRLARAGRTTYDLTNPEACPSVPTCPNPPTGHPSPMSHPHPSLEGGTGQDAPTRSTQ